MKKLIVASGLALVSLVAATSAEAACRQVFSHTTCTGIFRNNCTNHFKQQCDAPVARIVAPPPQNRVNVQPSLTGSRFISDQGGGLISNNKGGLISDNGLGARGGNGFISTNGGTMRR